MVTGAISLENQCDAHWKEIKVKSEIARPRAYEPIALNQKYTVIGAAWAGET
jgi:hypothetical protein